eukprot:TRINITY_DN957_c0_g1_i1.p1 TRINITY_DN957_c0_g1~~TRINITY_DN957_c0_g1_i1.p1  ORF type:complete len:550 (-),score=84.81 TRINITY_DN957_c0_g1_i1:86-1735(-)
MSMIGNLLSASVNASTFEIRRCVLTVHEFLSVSIAGLHCSLLWQKLRTSISKRRALPCAALITSAVLFMLCFNIAGDQNVPNACPAISSPPKMSPGSASILLSKARAAEMNHDLGGAQVLYRQCVQEAPVIGRSVPTSADIRAQLECLADLDAESGEGLSSNGNIVGARIAKNALMAARGVCRQCMLVHDKLSSFVRSDSGTLHAGNTIVSLGGVAGLEGSLRDVFLSLRLLMLPDLKSLRDSVAQASEAVSIRDELLKCALMSARQARLLAHRLSSANLAVRRVNECKPNLLAGFESVSLAESNGVADADVAFHRGLLMSEIICAPAKVPFFGAKDHAGSLSAEWSADSKGHRIPAKISLSEQLMHKGVLSAEGDAESAERSRVYALRLAAHAMHLVEMKQNSAAEWRYEISSSIATERGPAEFASNSLGLLSYFHSLRGNTDKALDIAEKALTYGDDALSAYLRATLRLQVGAVVSDEQMYELLEQLQQVEDRLPAEHLETTRVKTLALLGKWRKISSAGSISSCIAGGDVADVLACILGRVAFWMS